MSKGFDPLKLDGRLVDGWAYALTVKEVGTVRVCDRDGPEAVWARVKEAKVVGGDVTFSGCRSEAEGKVDGYGVFDAADVLALRNFGPSVVGAGSVEARIMKLEERADELAEAINDHAGALNSIEAALGADEGPEEGEEARPLESEKVKDAIAADAAASADE